jgi:hypothetical protein
LPDFLIILLYLKKFVAAAVVCATAVQNLNNLFKVISRFNLPIFPMENLQASA